MRMKILPYAIFSVFSLKIDQIILKNAKHWWYLTQSIGRLFWSWITPLIGHTFSEIWWHMEWIAIERSKRWVVRGFFNLKFLGVYFTKKQLSENSYHMIGSIHDKKRLPLDCSYLELSLVYNSTNFKNSLVIL